MNRRLFLTSALFFMLSTVTHTLLAQQTQPWTSSRPDGHAPIGVMGDHRHSKGEWMLSYRYMPMWMNGNLQGSKAISNEQIYQSYMVAPQQMMMRMHMFGIMHATSDRLTLMAMGSYLTNNMDLRSKMGMNFTTIGQGFGDVKVTALYSLLNRNQQSVHVNVGVSIPTGSITEKDDTPAEKDMQLPYPMQVGSGTWDVLPGLTYLGQADALSWGGQLMGTLRLGENDQGYALGNGLQLTAWAAHPWCDWLSSSLRVQGATAGKISGRDAMLKPMMVTTADPANSGGQQVMGYIGTNFYVRQGLFTGHRLAVEFGIPLYQHPNGIQMQTRSVFTLGWQWAI